MNNSYHWALKFRLITHQQTKTNAHFPTDFSQRGNVVARQDEAKINLREFFCFDHILCLKDGQSLCSWRSSKTHLVSLQPTVFSCQYCIGNPIYTDIKRDSQVLSWALYSLAVSYDGPAYWFSYSSLLILSFSSQLDTNPTLITFHNLKSSPVPDNILSACSRPAENLEIWQFLKVK